MRPLNATVGTRAVDAAAADPVSADEWLRREPAAPPDQALMRDLSIREANDRATVTLRLDRQAGDKAATHFVVHPRRGSTGRLLSPARARA